VLIATLICIIKGVKPIITPRGMLGAYTLQPALKRGIHFFIGKYLLSRCTLHATTQMEWEECQQLIPHWQGFTLPNIIKLPITLPNRKPTEQFTIAYLSRIDPKKGLELSLQALAKVNFPFKLKIAGKGDLGYIEELKKLIENLGLKHAIEWVGWKAGDEKYDFLAAADIFLLTSYNENFANVVIESLSVGTPVLVSNKVGIYDFVQQENLGWVSKLTIDSICTQLENAFKEKNKREKIFNNAPATVKKAFASDYLAKQYINAYQKYGC
jgi:glycosyltransferase involved in cell wall biosynthesis